MSGVLSPVHTSNSIEATFEFVEATFDFVAKTVTMSNEFSVKFHSFDFCCRFSNNHVDTTLDFFDVVDVFWQQCQTSFS